MDHWMKLSKRMKNNNFNQFKASLEHWESKLTPKHYSLLIFQILNSRNDRQKDYLDLFSKYQVDINAKYNSKEKQLKLPDKTALMLACEKSNFSAVNSLLHHKNIKVSLVDSKGENCIFYALKNPSQQQCYQIIRTLLNKDLANSSNFQGKSVLFQAVEKKSLRIVEMFLKNLADPNFQCKKSGNTALHKALLNPFSNSQKKKDIILLLLNHKADPMIKNKQEKNCFEIAKEVNFDLDWLIQLIKQTEQPNQQIKFCHQEINSQTKEDQNSVAQIVSEYVSEYEQSDTQEEEYSVEKLSIQIQNFTKNCEKDHIESWNDVKFIYEELAKIGAGLHLKIDIVGSYATGLWTPASDIDIVFTNIEFTSILIEDTLEKIYIVLRQRSPQLGIRQIYLNNKNTSNCFPNIKIDLIPKLHNRKIDITIFQKKNNSQKYVQYVITQLNMNPKIKAVFFALHKLLQTFNLNNPSKNGLKTYAVFLMVLISAATFEANTIGQLFVYTIYYFAYIFTYEQLQNGQSRMNIYDPLNPTNNVGGRRTDVGRLREMFRATDYGLRIVSGRNILDYIFNLHNIFQK